jgi:hypothetical protein
MVLENKNAERKNPTRERERKLLVNVENDIT